MGYHIYASGKAIRALFADRVTYMRPGLRKQGMWAQTTYTLSFYRPYLSIETQYLNSVACIIKPIKCLLRAEIVLLYSIWYKKLRVMEV